MEDRFGVRGGLPVPAIIQLEEVSKDQGARTYPIPYDQRIAIIIDDNLNGRRIGQYNSVEWIAGSERIRPMPRGTCIHKAHELDIADKGGPDFLP